MTDPYTEVAEYVARRVTLADYGTWLVKLSLDGREVVELLSYDKNDGFTWANDWYEGESDVQVIDFVCVNDVDPAIRWHSVADCGYPKDDTVCIVTYVLYDGTRIVDDSYTHLMDVSKLVDKRTNEGKRYIAEHPDGVWVQWYSDGYWKDARRSIIAWMPYPEPYRGE